MILDVFSLVFQEFFSWTNRVNFFSSSFEERKKEGEGREKESRVEGKNPLVQ